MCPTIFTITRFAANPNTSSAFATPSITQASPTATTLPPHHQLHLDTCKKVDQNQFKDMTVELAPHLRSFSWHWAYGTSESALTHLVRGRTHLRSLKISHLEGMGAG